MEGKFRRDSPGTRARVAALQRSRYIAVGYILFTVAAYLPESGSKQRGWGEEELENCFRKDFPRSKSFNNLEAIVPTLNCSASRIPAFNRGLKGFPREIESKPGLARAFPTSSINIRAWSQREMKINDWMEAS